METEIVYIKRYGVTGQILWKKDGLYKITFSKNGKVKTEIFIEEEFEFREFL